MLLVALVGCVGDSVTDDLMVPPQTPRSTGGSCQGRHMLGAAPDALTDGMPGHRFASVQPLSSNLPVTVSVVNGGLVARDGNGVVLYSGASPKFIGMRLKTQAGPELEITGVSTETYGSSYKLAFQLSKTDYCDGAGSAVAMQGVIEADRFHVLTSDVTFGCPDGVLEKCHGWGYRPDSDPTGVPWKLHQACMRMANADIYGDGESHTRELTPIVIRDLVAGANPAPTDAPAIGYPVMSPPPPGIPFFEAAWTGQRNRGALCLAHDRWLSEPLDGPQNADLPDPRQVDNVVNCIDLTYPQMLDGGALLFNASKRMDMYLNRWRNPATGDLLTTLRGRFNHITTRHLPPFPGYTEFLGTDGVMLRNRTGRLDTGDVTEMYMQHNPVTDDYVVATSTPVAPGYVVGDFEGYTLNIDGPDLIPFWLFVRGNDYVSATIPPPGYTLVAPLHNVMRTATSQLPASTAAHVVLGEREAPVCPEQ